MPRLHYLEMTTGRGLDEEPAGLGLWHIYRISEHEVTDADVGLDPSAHFDHVESADKLVEQPGLTGDE